MKSGFWARDWFAALVVCVVFAMAAWWGNSLLVSLERAAYDLGVQGSERTPSDKIAIIAIDDQSIANIGRIPWPRDIHADLLDVLSEGDAKVVGSMVMFLEPQIDPGLAQIERIAEIYRDSGASLPELAEALSEAMSALDTDGKLADSIGKAGNVVLAMPFALGVPLGRPDADLPDYVGRNALARVRDRSGGGASPIPALDALAPIEALGKNALAIGHLNLIPDVDGAIRTEPLVIDYFGAAFPSLSLQLAARSLNLGADEIEVSLGEGVSLGGLTVRTDPALLMNTFYYGDRDGRSAFPVDSFFDVLTGKIPPEKYKGKIVLIGSAATGIGDAQVTPISQSTAPVVTLAHAVSSILQEDFFVVPAWAGLAEAAVFLTIALYLIVGLPRLSAVPAATGTGATALLLFGAEYFLLTNQAIWLSLMTPATLLVAGHVLLTTKRFFTAERGKQRSDAESAESHRMLGLQHQGKGELDMAFAAFRKLPPDEGVLDLVYNLALDFERKRQFNKAGAAYRYIAEHDPQFRDIEKRLTRSQAMEETVLLGTPGGGLAPGTLMLDGEGIQKPMLGRYEIEKELGKGAMGVVYLGRDPKINRVVAIKTMALSEEFEEDEVDEVKERFFREAETAGRLTHPNIVTIYDAGEEHDLAYIAMEFLKGQDLAAHVKPDALLSLDTVVDICCKAADALDYAHRENVVHRDIKPANIMFQADTGGVKLTDFGIARITDSSKTKTGMVLGTPSYMSPEQLAGKKVDGRSDLFSLGVMLYQMCTGVLPFTGDSMATLMFKIANEPHPDVMSFRPDLPPCLKAVIDKALAKTANDRYSRGAELVRDLKMCAEQLAA